jgi:hypothetical protein
MGRRRGGGGNEGARPRASHPTAHSQRETSRRALRCDGRHGGQRVPGNMAQAEGVWEDSEVESGESDGAVGLGGGRGWFCSGENAGQRNCTTNGQRMAPEVREGQEKILTGTGTSTKQGIARRFGGDEYFVEKWAEMNNAAQTRLGEGKCHTVTQTMGRGVSEQGGG